MEKFRKLGISEKTLKAIQEEKFSEPSEIQEKAIPLIMEGKDVIAGAATGSGKTLVFAARIIKNVEKGKGIQALILVPTRELAEQVTKDLKRFSKYNPLTIIAVYGGVSIGPQIIGLEHADIVVGTPGRILDHLDRDTLKTDLIKILVLDEADRMLDMGFVKDVEKIVRNVPPKRQTLLFSATIDADIDYLARKYMHSPVEVQAESYVDPSKLTQFYYEVPGHLKFSLLVHLLENETAKLVMVFCNTRRNTDFVAKNLKYSGIDAMAIHGGFSQDKRTRTMDSFRDKRLYVLVCTDIAARGLDIKEVSHVYNYDIPKDSKDYIHRVGRTARAGKEGKAISLVTERDFENFRRVLRNPDLSIKPEKMPNIERIRIKWFDDSENRFAQRRYSPSYGESRRGRTPYRGRGGFREREGGRDRDEGDGRARPVRSRSRDEGRREYRRPRRY